MTERQGPSRSLQIRQVAYPGARARPSPGGLRFCIAGTAALAAREFPLGPGGWLLGLAPTACRIWPLPFVRQFRLADRPGFDNEPRAGPCSTGSSVFFWPAKAFLAVMGSNCAGRSLRFLYQTGTGPLEWDEGRGGQGCISARPGARALEQVGIHPRQLGLTSWRQPPAFPYDYADAGAVRLAHQLIPTGFTVP